jgi:hypothetical protein
VSPVRLADSRVGSPDGAVAIAKRRYSGDGNILRVEVTGVGGVPDAAVGAVSLNVVAVDPSGAGYVTVFPCGARPLVASVNYTAGEIVPNAVIAPVSPDGEVCLFSLADTHLVVDLNGWFAA